ncbi:phenol hydroxylase subunit [Marinospirillum insulare]|uniref:Phenol 2-monooxygenase n=1 Tax=Marinospirillum insulare TaxID=217169 RepID=A0ABQ5ZZN7_9GAMM|nr:phenol hydroxylase subunit [Marinospirillum insulare]GLR64543.1 phenol 2-monooxygenase [Marinospirillum insulare]
MSRLQAVQKQSIASSYGLPNLTKYIRVRSKPDARFVEFDFAIGEPSLFVELIMPPAVFKVFCTNNAVVHMTDEQMADVDAELEKWRYGDEDTLMSQNRNRSA